jgi:hypothetical protein
MSSLLDWITLNSWAIALAAVAFACVGYALTRPVALRGSSSTDDPTIWAAFCMGLYPDTRKVDDDNDEGASIDGADAGIDGGDSGGD